MTAGGVEPWFRRLDTALFAMNRCGGTPTEWRFTFEDHAAIKLAADLNCGRLGITPHGHYRLMGLPLIFGDEIKVTMLAGRKKSDVPWRYDHVEIAVG